MKVASDFPMLVLIVLEWIADHLEEVLERDLGSTAMNADDGGR